MGANLYCVAMRDGDLRKLAEQIPTYQPYNHKCERLCRSYPNLPNIDEWGLEPGSRAVNWLVLECSDDEDWDPVSDAVFMGMCTLIGEVRDRSPITSWLGMKPILLWVMSGETSVDRLARLRYVRSVQLWDLRKRNRKGLAATEQLWVPVQVASWLRDKDWLRERYDWAMDASLSEISKAFEKELVGNGPATTETAATRLAWWSQRMAVSGLYSRHDEGFGSGLDRRKKMLMVEELSERVFGMLVELCVEAGLSVESLTWAVDALSKFRTIDDRIQQIVEWRLSKSSDFRERIRKNGGVPTEWWTFEGYQTYPITKIVERFK